jgi:hypothetical protein
MRDRKFAIGIGVSVAWIGVAVWMAITLERPTKLNEWGDFIAGFSAPLAFFWLVLGYLQQGEELKNNTEALRLQAEELKHSTDALKLQAEELRNSVEQQSQLVAVSREQMALEISTLEEERSRRAKHARPKFIARRQSSVGSGGVKHHVLEITNVGSQVTGVDIAISPAGEASPQRFEIFGREHTYTATLRYVTDADYIVDLTYFDADGNYGAAKIKFSMTHTSLVAEPVQFLL